MRRRTFLWLAGASAVSACIDVEAPAPEPEPEPGTPDAGTATVPDATPQAGPDACVDDTVLLHDTNAQALYLDGSYGPLTGNIKVDYVLAGATITLDFWHGHGGVSHRFTLDATTFAKLKAHEKVYVTTTTVDGHEHTLFIDPTDEAYRVDGAPDVSVPVGNC
jgi:hypothetical protein